ncbi:MAG: ECF-type sigma factor, partial [Gemmatimonadetes bacterium]|nr:ECF-type sigma factor [Gemmatimonadota bacterium]
MILDKIFPMTRQQVQSPFTRLLVQASQGNEAALNELVPLVYKELRRLAHRVVRSNRPDQTLRTTALIHEAYLRLAGAEVSWQDRVHF